MVQVHMALLEHVELRGQSWVSSLRSCLHGVFLADGLQSLLVCLCFPVTGITSTHHPVWLFTQILGTTLKHTPPNLAFYIDAGPKLKHTPPHLAFHMDAGTKRKHTPLRLAFHIDAVTKFKCTLPHLAFHIDAGTKLKCIPPRLAFHTDAGSKLRSPCLNSSN